MEVAVLLAVLMVIPSAVLLVVLLATEEGGRVAAATQVDDDDEFDDRDERRDEDRSLLSAIAVTSSVPDSIRGDTFFFTDTEPSDFRIENSFASLTNIVMLFLFKLRTLSEFVGLDSIECTDVEFLCASSFSFSPTSCVPSLLSRACQAW